MANPSPSVTTPDKKTKPILPCVMDFICKDFLFARLKIDAKFDGLAVGLNEIIRLFDNLPVDPAI